MIRAMMLASVVSMVACGPASIDAFYDDPGSDPMPGQQPSGSEGKADGVRTPTGTLGPPYPLILVHGLFGFDEMAGGIEGFPGVPAALQQDGEVVYVAKLDPLNDSTVRGEQLRAFIDVVRAKENREKVILVGHSQGGLCARYAASKAPGKVAAVVTIGTPHQGAYLADTIFSVVNEQTAQLTDAVFKLLGKPFFGSIVEGSSSWAALNQLTTQGMKAFNAKVQDQVGVEYFSLSGRSGYVPADGLCAQAQNPPFVAKYAGVNDTINAMLMLTGLAIRGPLTAPTPHDGVVRVSESIWGSWLGCIPADHLDQSGQGPGTPSAFDPLQLYRDLATYLRARGL